MNARSNPFASRRVESLGYQCTDISWGHILKRLETLNYRAAIVGPEGSGKTTLLESIGVILRKKGFQTAYLRFDEENNRFNPDFFKNIAGNRMADHAFLVDGEEQLSLLSRKRLFRCTKNAGALIITAHKKADLPVLVKTGTTPELLYDLVLKLVGKNDMISGQEIDRLYEVYCGNMRLAFRELYDLWADTH